MSSCRVTSCEMCSYILDEGTPNNFNGFRTLSEMQKVYTLSEFFEKLNSCRKQILFFKQQVT